MLRSRSTRRARLFVSAHGGLALHIAHGPLGVDFGVPAGVFDDWIYNFVLVGSALVCIARATLVREERVAWALIGAGLLAWCSADLYYTAVLSKLAVPPYPSISDFGWLVYYPAVWIAVVLLMRRRIREFHPSLWLDGVVAALGWRRVHRHWCSRRSSR